MEPLSHRKRSRVDSPEYEFESSKVKRIREDLLSLLDDSDTVLDRDPASQDLDSVIRSFEEVCGSGSSSPVADPVTHIDRPSVSSDNLVEVSGVGAVDWVTTEWSGIGELWEFQDELPNYDPFEFGLELDYERNIVTGDVNDSEVENDYVALDGLFDYSDVNIGSDFWRPETLPAL